MRLIVIRRDGQREIVRLALPASIMRHPNSPLWLISSADGLDHYFTLEGYYDGWGMNVEGQDLSVDEAMMVIEAVETERAIQSDQQGGR
jgi:hypothetical protein